MHGIERTISVSAALIFLFCVNIVHHQYGNVIEVQC